MDSSGVMRRIGRWSRLVVCLLATGIVSLSGCGSDKVKPIVGPIAFTDISGQQLQGPVVSLNVNQGAYMMVNLTNDSAMLGADWSVSCASALPPGTPLPPGQVQDLSCGTFTPRTFHEWPDRAGRDERRGVCGVLYRSGGDPEGEHGDAVCERDLGPHAVLDCDAQHYRSAAIAGEYAQSGQVPVQPR